ncbi:MAG: ABC transporter ATP-binding protein [Bacteroidota bacterium]
MKPVIEINQLGKKYRIRKTEPYLSFRDTITDSVKNIFRKKTENKKDFWALQDINISIGAGERVGIIGRNGAGKSTLLKILSRITWPTTGHAIIRGRLSSLLEVGTGFHPELTGRENIYLNGSILGLKKTEIDKQFDAIVDFSGVETFLDTPLKHYSSGMQLRLAFAVAAHLEPEVLLIDEVLAVGDMEFQKKCMGKMEEVSRQHGRTILFVSHNLKAINDICSRAVWMDNGKIKIDDTVNTVTTKYIESLHTGNTKITRPATQLTGAININDISILDAHHENKNIFTPGEKIGIAISLSNLSWTKNFSVGLALNTLSKGRILTDTIQLPAMDISSSIKKMIAWLPAEYLTPNTYIIDISVMNDNSGILDIVTDAAGFEIAITNTKFENLEYDYGVFSKELVWEPVA